MRCADPGPAIFFRSRENTLNRARPFFAGLKLNQENCLCGRKVIFILIFVRETIYDRSLLRFEVWSRICSSLKVKRQESPKTTYDHSARICPHYWFAQLYSALLTQSTVQISEVHLISKEPHIKIMGQESKYLEGVAVLYYCTVKICSQERV